MAKPLNKSTVLVWNGEKTTFLALAMVYKDVLFWRNGWLVTSMIIAVLMVIVGPVLGQMLGAVVLGFCGMYAANSGLQCSKACQGVEDVLEKAGYSPQALLALLD